MEPKENEESSASETERTQVIISNTASSDVTMESTESRKSSADDKMRSGNSATSDLEDAAAGMEEGGEAELKIPREHARLDSLLSQIPKKAQHGLLMQCDLILTCIDANEHFIALGTNIGLTFLYGRKDQTVQRLKSEVSNEVITCIKLHHGVDHQLATGMASGSLCIFLIPSYISQHKKQLQKFDVRSVHRHYITCVEWSTNGMKLFSGDKTGHVVVTEVDFYQGECKSSLLLVEPPTEIVQLNYDHKVLLISTKQRSFVCRLDTAGETVQAGQQERKVKGNFGACFIPGLCKVEDALLYAARPGCRVWLASISGAVLNTHIFKESINAGVHEIPVLRPSKSTFNPNAELQFSRLLIYKEKQLITYNTTTLFVLDPKMNRVVASQNRLGGIVDVAVHKDEVFVLRRHNEDSVIRIALEPEEICHRAMPFDLPLSTTTAGAASTNASPTATPITAKKQEPHENKTKAFFKKNFFAPLKKLDNFIHEQKAHIAESLQDRPQPPQSLHPVIKSAADTAKPPSGQNKSEDSSPDLPPVVHLDSPDLDLRVFTGGSKEAGTPVDIKSPDSAHSALSVFADEAASPVSEGVMGSSGLRVQITAPQNKDEASGGQGHLGPIGDRIDLSASPGNGQDDIVFAHQAQKKKGKKKKLKGKGGLEAESDNISQSSFGSQVSEDPRAENNHQQSSAVTGEEGVDDILRRAEEALSSATKFLTGVDGNGDLHNKTKGREINNSSCGTSLTDSNKSEDKTDSASETASSQTLVNEPSSEQGQGVIMNTEDANKRSAAVKASKKSTKDVGALNNSAKNNTPKASGNISLQSVGDASLQSSSSAPGEHPGDSKEKPSGSSGEPVTPTSVTRTDPLSSGDVRKEEEEDPMLAAERTLDSMTRYTKVKVRKEDSVDDFYSKFSDPYSPTESLESCSFVSQEHRSVSEVEDSETGIGRQVSTGSVSSASERSVPEATLYRLANSWSEFTTPANIYSLGLSSTHVWFTDKSENLYYSALGGTKGILWRKAVAAPSNQISVSPSGHIVWRLHRGKVFAGTKITQRHPEGLKWVEAVRDVMHMSVDDTCAWYVKKNGDVMMQRNLSKERPCFSGIPVETHCPIRQVLARHGVVWAISDTMKLLVRTGIASSTPQGTSWKEINRHTEPFLFSSVSVDNEGIGWAVDVLGQIWFTDAVSPQRPAGSGHWWQVPLSEYYVQDPTVLDMIRSIAKKFDTQKLSHILSTNRGGLIVAGAQGVWLALDYLNTLYVCRSSLQGYHWSPAQPSKMAESTVWKQVQSSIADLEWGTIWAQKANGELYSILLDSSDATLVDSTKFVSYTVNEHAVWGLTSDGEIHIRTGMGAHCPLGVDWTQLDLAQLGEAFIVHLSCNSSFVWVVDGDGQVFHRIGAAALKPGQLNPVWLPIDSYSEIVFNKVANGPVDWMVWAVDNRRLTYVRIGVSDELPIGKEWVHVPGIQALDITISSSGVWALNTNGEILFRYGITEDNVSGNYWKKIPGCFTKVSASPKDVLWAVDTAGQLMKCSSRHVFRRQDSSDPLLQRSVSTAGSEDGDWELV
ncbi:hypothetical protein V1264_018848 [Littorina saxatilis]|uniref:HPS5-like beta-propeller domain-containing protein n=2 Tax=Littorina saxatilis TaxID=31220 RepID=A0AAN9GDX1_9CAEN